MKRGFGVWCGLLTCALASTRGVQADVESGVPAPADCVRPQIATHKPRWFDFSSACRPFGMVNLSPDTRTGSDWGHGYVYGDKKIRCFSHIHCWQLYGVAVLPTVGAMKGHQGMDAYQADFSHDDEVVRPGYHKVVLSNYGITAELTSTARVGLHRYTYPAGGQHHVLFDTGARLMDPVASSEVRKVSATELAGHVLLARALRRPKPTSVYFVAQFDRPFEQFGGWKDKKVLEKPGDVVSGANVGAYVTFSEAGRPLLMKVAISYTSVENARKNLAAELPHWDFDRVRRESRDEWNRWLGRIEVQGGSPSQRIKFYTDLWHALLGRRTTSDADGSYCDMTGPAPRVRRGSLGADGRPRFPHHNFDALWGSQWNVNLLWAMAYPEVMDAFCNTMVDMYRDGGLIPRGPAGGNYTYVMIGDPAAPFFAAAYAKGIRHYDAAKAYEGLRKNAFPGGLRDHAGYEHRANATGGGMTFYVDRGYVPEGIGGRGAGWHRDGAAMTLEYAWQDWCLAQLAKALGKEEDYRLFSKRARNYRHLWNPETGYMHPRNQDGSWLKGFQPTAAKGFCEGTSAMYTHWVPQDMPGLIALCGGQERYAQRLDRQFESAEKDGFCNAWVHFGNQPSLALTHLFNWAEAPWLSQKWVRRVQEKVYGDTTPQGGYSGDEDQGQMGAFSALMAIGLFDIQGGAAGRPTYQITSPVFEKVVIHLDDKYYPGRTFSIETTNHSAANVYIQSARFNGKPWNQCWFHHADFAAGGKLELVLGPQPNKAWGRENALPLQAEP